MQAYAVRRVPTVWRLSIMATRQRKTPAKPGAVSSVIVAYVESCVKHLDVSADLKAAFDRAHQSAGNTWSNLMAIVAECKTVAELHAMIGNGLQASNPKRTEGSLGVALKDAMAKLDADKAKKLSDSVKSQVSKGRTVAMAVIEKGYKIDSTLGRDKQVAAAKAHAEGKTVTPKGAAAPKAGDGDTLGQLVAKYGLAAVLAKCAEILGSTKSTATQAAAIAAVAQQIKTA